MKDIERGEGLPSENELKPQDSEFGTLVRHLCDQRGFTLRRLAHRADIDSGYLSRSLKDGSLSMEAICRLADVLRASPVEMLIAAGKLRRRFPYEVLKSEGAREACQKVAEGERLTSKDKDWLIEIWYAWRPPPKRRGRRKRTRRLK